MRISTCPVPRLACSIPRVRRPAVLPLLLAVLSAIMLASCGLTGESVVLEAAPTSTPDDVLELPGGTSTTSAPRTTTSNAPPTTFVEPSTTTTEPPEPTTTTSTTTTTTTPEPEIQRASWCDDFDQFADSGGELVAARDRDAMIEIASSMESARDALVTSDDRQAGSFAAALEDPMKQIGDGIDRAPTVEAGFDALRTVAEGSKTEIDNLIIYGNENCHGVLDKAADLTVLPG